MSIRFAAPPSPRAHRMAKDHVRLTHFLPANDVQDAAQPEAHLHAALRHFAKHGLAAAQHAREQAVAAAEAGDRQTFEWWLEICRALDRRMARSVETAAEASH